MAVDLELAVLAMRVDELERDVAAMMRELGGVANGTPDHKPVRTRLHKLESNDAALILLDEFRKQRRRAWQWWVMAAFAGVGAFLSVLVVLVAVFSGTS